MTALSKISKWLSISEPEAHTYSFSRHEYYNRIINPRNVEDMISQYEHGDKKIVYTDIKIRFNGADFGDKMKGFLKTHKPRHIIENLNNNRVNHSVLFYKEKMGRHNVVTQMHYVDNNLFWGTYLFSNNLDKIQVKEIEKALIEKYGIEEEVDLKNVLICDIDKNMIELKNDMFTSISYISGRKSVIDQLKFMVKEFKQLIRVTSGSEQQNLVEKL